MFCVREGYSTTKRMPERGFGPFGHPKLFAHTHIIKDAAHLGTATFSPHPH